MLHALILVLAAQVGFLAPDPDGVWQFWVSASPGSTVRVTHSEVDVQWLSPPAEDGSLVATFADGTAIVFGPTLKELEHLDLGRGSDQAAISPDGRWIVYSAAVGSGAQAQRDLFLYDRTTSQRRPWASRPGMQHSPTWSPDGKQIVFAEVHPGAGQTLWSRTFDGSREEQRTVGNQIDVEPTLGGDASLYFSSNRDGDYDIYRMTPELRIEKILESAGYDGTPRISPDDARLLFLSDRSGGRQIWVAPLDGSSAEPRVTGFDSFRAPVWLRGTEALVAEPGWIAHLRADEEGRWQPWTVRSDGTGLRRVAELPKDPSRLSVSKDGRTMLACSSDGAIYRIDIASGAVTELKVEPGGSTDAAISPDGTRIAYSASTLGGIDTNDLWVVSIEGGVGKKLTSQNYMQHFPAWAPDGDLYYLSGRGGQVHDLWRVPSGGGSPEEVLGEHRYNFEPSVSPQGRIAFSSNAGAGNGYDIYLMDSDHRQIRSLTDHPGYDGQPSFSPSGEQLVYVSRHSGAAQLWVVDVESKVSKPLSADAEVRMPIWYGSGPDSREVAEIRE